MVGAEAEVAEAAAPDDAEAEPPPSEPARFNFGRSGSDESEPPELPVAPVPAAIAAAFSSGVPFLFIVIVFE